VAERLHVGAAHFHRAIDEVARYDDQVGASRVGTIDDGPCPRGGEQPADVEVGKLDNAVAVEGCRKVVDRDCHVSDRRYTERVCDTDRGNERC
jgi:hypothetical protein